MQAAALELVEIIYGDDETNPNLYVAVVPYVAMVNIGADRLELAAHRRSGVATGPALVL